MATLRHDEDRGIYGCKRWMHARVLNILKVVWVGEWGGRLGLRSHIWQYRRCSPDVLCMHRYPCIYCGPTTKYDFDKVEQDNEEEAYHLMDNFKAALANKCGPLLQSPIRVMVRWTGYKQEWV